MKVCLINNLCKPFNRGGAETVVELISQGFSAQNIEVVVISTRPFFNKIPLSVGLKIKNYYLPSVYYDLDKLPIFVRFFWHLFDLFNFYICNKVKNILKKEQPDVVITHNLKGLSYLLPIVIKKLKIKHLHYIHDIQLIHPSGLMLYGQERQNQKFLAKIYQAICRWLFASPDVVISPSKWLLGYYLDKKFFSNSKKIVLPNPAPLFTKSKESNQAKDGIFKFIYVGQIEKHKGIIFLIKVFNELIKKTKKDIKLIILGDGSALSDIKKMAGNSHINILGRIDREGVAEYLRQADCLIAPSLCYENSPTVIYEAFSAGLPVIASRIGGIIEIMKDSQEMLFKPGDKEDLINKMLWLLANQEKLREISQRELINIQNFSLEKYFKKLSDIMFNI
ncbi:MAG: glycosyltransferase [Patescibacteria group bacterium]